MLPSLAEIMQPGMPHVPHSGPMQVHNQPLSQIISPPGMTYVVPELKPLTPPPTNLQMARPSRPWRMYGRVVGLVILLFLFEIFVFEGWLYAIYYGDTLTGSISLLCAIPILLWVVAIRRPRAVLLERAVPDARGQQMHVISVQPGSLQTPMPTRFDRHLLRDDSILDVPSSLASWIVFGVTVLCSGGLWYMIYAGDEGAQILAILLLIPVIIIGFSIPVMGWWSHSTKRIGLPTKRRDAEAWLMAGIFSALPAIFINSIIFPEIVLLIHPSISFEGLNQLGAVISAPVGEEICKGAAILVFASKIRSPKHGFQIGFTVGLGFAILENLMYIASSAGFPITMLIRGIGSIPGHAIWTGLTGAAIGWTMMHKRAQNLHHAAQRGLPIKAPEKQSTDWKLIDEKTGEVIDPTNQMNKSGVSVDAAGFEIWTPNQPVITKEPWIRIPLPKSISLGLILAMIGHASWNGTLTIFEIISEDMGLSDGAFLVFQLIIVIVMIAFVWIIGTGLLHSVREAPDGREVDQYQQTLSTMNYQ